MLVRPLPKNAILPHEKRKSRNHQSLKSVFRMIVEDFERRNPRDISIVKITKNKNIQHRRVYDFFNMLTSLNVCSYINKGKLTWNGVSSLSQSILDAYSQIEIDSIDYSISTIFCAGPSPSLGTIALKFLSLYLFFGVETFFFKNATLLLHYPGSDIKSLERRIYLVLNFLEVLGTVSHTSKTSEYRLNINVDSIVESAINARVEVIKKRNTLSVENLLNRLDKSYTESLRIHRREELFYFTKIPLK